MAMGRPTKYNKTMLAKAQAYLDGGYLDVDQVIPSRVGLAVYLGVVSSTVNNWAEEHPDFLATLKAIEDGQHTVALSKGLDGTFNSAITKLVLHNHGYSDKSSQELSGPGGKPIENTWTVVVKEASE